jgi:hypothetical protein
MYTRIFVGTMQLLLGRLVLGKFAQKYSGLMTVPIE